MSITSDNFFRIEGWMRTELNLKGNELMAYALIYSFQTAYNKPFDGSQAYIAEWLGIKRGSVNRVVQSLEDKGVLRAIPTRRGFVTFCSYDVLLDGSIAENINSTSHKMLQSPVTKCDSDQSQNVTATSHKMLHKTDIETDILNRTIKERGDATEVAPSLAPSNSVENSDSNSETKKPKAKAKQKRFKKPTGDEIRDYCESKGISLDVDYFMNYYESNGWMVGRNHMKDWRATVQNWAKREKQYNWKGTNNAGNTRNTTNATSDYISEYDYEPDEIIYT